MNEDKGVKESRKNQDVCGIEAPERSDSNLFSALQNPPEIVTDQGGGASNVSPDHSGPVCLLVPGQQIACEPKKHDQKKQDYAKHPGKLPRVLVSSHEKDPKQMGEDHYYDETCAPVVQASDEGPEGDLLLDVGHAVIGVLRGRNIIKSEKKASDGLNQD